jgi:hypothetical protein
LRDASPAHASGRGEFSPLSVSLDPELLVQRYAMAAQVVEHLAERPSLAHPAAAAGKAAAVEYPHSASLCSAAASSAAAVAASICRPRLRR